MKYILNIGIHNTEVASKILDYVRENPDPAEGEKFMAGLRDWYGFSEGVEEDEYRIAVKELADYGNLWIVYHKPQGNGAIFGFFFRGIRNITFES